ncbi:sensor histidine kinase [Telmatospirillum siberiense]|uniref:histidine kinase n=1 Tax=Telmatospirillum siberiense TaxID=382514 RepID=A0A2N3PY86_9PROT|nr:sensor histidine kinase KdpD [Telmatospirillum siberiense]PKU25374.1 two-component sensor histidine kinase [Telmatospirillum siberiense]
MADNDRDNRPSPDALLAEAQKETRGRLKIFLGAAPGVGKTYAMLETAHERQREGVDVVIGVVETHGRKETERLVRDLPALPSRIVDYRGRPFQEMDLEAILARRPRIVLVDELAHTNVPGSRHIKRYQDVEDILTAGIDVYSTLNIQHLESLNDVIERIAGIKVRETLPDSVLATADEIEMIDLPPEDLLKRLAEGKVYVPEQARRAVSNFFSAGNLTALREMALRHAAERVDAQMLNYRRAHAISGPWPTRERIIVCIGDDTASARLVRTAKRVAERRSAPWMAVYVETSRHGGLDEPQKDRIAQTMRLAEQLGGETVTLQGEDVAAEVVAFARERNASQIVVGRPRRRAWWRLPAATSVTRRILAKSEDFDVLLVGGEDTERSPRTFETKAPEQAWTWTSYLIAAIGVAAATGLGFVIDLWLPVPNISVAFLVAVMLIAMRLGRGAAVFASVASFLSFNFFFTEPRFSFAISDSQNILTIVFFLIAAIIVSNLASRVQVQVDATKTSARRTANLYEFSRKIAAGATRDDVLWAVVHHVAATIRGKSLVLLPDEGRLSIAAGYPPEDELGDKDAGAADWTWANGRPSGRGSTTLPAADWLFLPLKTARGPIGVLGMQMAGQEQLTPEDSRLLETLADQAAVAIERTILVADVEAARLAAETDRLRSALLSSLSHDLRTPLVSILGAASSLINYGDALEAKDRRDLAGTIQDEAERLNRFVQNLLDMTKLGSGALKPNADWADLNDVVRAAVDRSGKLLKGRQIKVDIDAGMPLLRLDSILMEQVFFNLLDNACKYSPPGSQVTIWARTSKDLALIEVCDQGAGIPEADRERVFDMFYRVEATDKQTAGTGLGLAICRGIVEAHDGTIKAEPGLHGAGTCIVIHLPLGAPPTLDSNETAGV